MLSRMPNWKIRANGLAEGIPITSALQNPETGIDLHDAHELENEVDAHDAVGIEHDCELVIFAPTCAEVADVAGLDRDVVAATTVCQRDAPAPCWPPAPQRQASSAAAISSLLVSLRT